MQIITAPDPRLRVKTKKVERMTPEIQQHIEEMLDLVESGLGLAAPQVGLDLSIFVTNYQGRKVFINPEITLSGDLFEIEEGCMSLPGVVERMQRYSHVEMLARNKNMEIVRVEANGMGAVILQHEYDHLQGILISDGNVV